MKHAGVPTDRPNGCAVVQKDFTRHARGETNHLGVAEAE
jgi:hypothetical protein